MNRLLALAIAISSTLPARAITIETVPIGSIGNSNDPATGNLSGGVNYTYSIGKYEVTVGQYAAFLNAVAATDSFGLYSLSMASETSGGIVRNGLPGSYTYQVKPPALSGTYIYDDKPVAHVGSGDAMRFVNWLHNGQPSGPQNSQTTEDGAYTLNGAVNVLELTAVSRNAGSRWWLPNHNEWHKAAYHANDGPTGNYWEFPTGSNSGPNNLPPSADTGNSANFYDLLNDAYTTGNQNYPLTDVGAYLLSESPYGTFDQGGNILEWTETVSLDFGFFRIVRGGAWDNIQVSLGSGTAGFADADHENWSIGFRVASIPLPGDLNLDGKVNAADYVLWRLNPASFPANAYGIWRANFGNPPSGSSASQLSAVPEPRCLFALIITLSACISRRR
jgi:formylglycine-generating enzyme required for sulfatase activity